MAEQIEIATDCDGLESPHSGGEKLCRVGAGSVLLLLRDEDRDYYKVAFGGQPVFIPKSCGLRVQTRETLEIPGSPLRGKTIGGAIASRRDDSSADREQEPRDTGAEEQPAAHEIVEAYQLYVARRLAQGGHRSAIVAELVHDGWPGDVAEQLVQNAQLALAQLALNAYGEPPAVRAERRSKYARHILFGALWAIGGTVVTLATYGAAEPGGTYVIAWGAMGVGALEFLYGLLGWLANQ